MPEDTPKRERKKPTQRKAATWCVQRELPDGTWERCAIHQDGIRLERFPVGDEGELPTVQAFAEMWGSGRYRMQPFDADNRGLGFRSAQTVDDPRRPRKDAYAGRPQVEAPPPPPPAPEPASGLGGLEQLLGSGAGTALALMTFMRNADADARARADADAERRHARMMAEYEQRSAHQSRMHQAELEASERRAAATIEQNRVYMQSMFQLHTAALRGGPESDDEDDDEPDARSPLAMFEAAFDSIGLDADARKQIAPGIVGVLKKFGGGSAPPAPSEDEAAE